MLGGAVHGDRDPYALASRHIMQHEPAAVLDPAGNSR